MRRFKAIRTAFIGVLLAGLVGPGCADSEQSAAHPAASSSGNQVWHSPAPAPWQALSSDWQESLLPFWGSSTQWEEADEHALYYVLESGQRSTQYHSTGLWPASQSGAEQQWRFAIGLDPDLHGLSRQPEGNVGDSTMSALACFELFARRAKTTGPFRAEHRGCWPYITEDQRRHVEAAPKPPGAKGSPLEDLAAEYARALPSTAVPALSLPFWMRQWTLYPGAKGRVAVRPQHGSPWPPLGTFSAADAASASADMREASANMHSISAAERSTERVAESDDAVLLDWRVLGTDSLQFQDARWHAWKLELRSAEKGAEAQPGNARAKASETRTLMCWIDRQYPHALIRWEGSEDHSGQLAARRWDARP